MRIKRDVALGLLLLAACPALLRNQDGRLAFEEVENCLWDKGCRRDELRAAVLRVQLRKLSVITAAMRNSKYRIRAALSGFREVQFRRVPDSPGDTGCFLITTYVNAETARRVNEGLKAEGIRTHPQGISNVLMTEWGLHLYYNIVSLVKKTGVAPGFLRDLAENRGLASEYGQGSCPVADSLSAASCCPYPRVFRARTRTTSFWPSREFCPRKRHRLVDVRAREAAPHLCEFKRTNYSPRR